MYPGSGQNKIDFGNSEKDLEAFARPAEENVFPFPFESFGSAFLIFFPSIGLMADSEG
jgi:hypothetical protein